MRRLISFMHVHTAPNFQETPHQHLIQPDAGPLASSLLEKATIPFSSHSLSDELVDCNTGVVVVEPKARCAIAVVTSGVGRSVLLRVIDGFVERHLRVNHLAHHTKVLSH